MEMDAGARFLVRFQMPMTEENTVAWALPRSPQNRITLPGQVPGATFMKSKTGSLMHLDSPARQPLDPPALSIPEEQ